MPSLRRLSIHIVLVPIAAVALVSVPGLAQQSGAPAASTSRALREYRAVTAARLRNPEDGNWLMIRRTYDGWGHSPLAQINTDNVARLQPGGADRQRWRHVRLDAQH